MTAADESFGGLLRHYRLRQDWNTEFLAERAGCTHTAISRWENGERHPSREMAERVVTALGVGPYEQALLLVAAGYVPRFGTVVLVEGRLLAVTGGRFLAPVIPRRTPQPRAGSCVVCHDASLPIKARRMCARHYMNAYRAEHGRPRKHHATARKPQPARDGAA